eukprot:384688-Pelagomonas_calceolata.AAC.4
MRHACACRPGCNLTLAAVGPQVTGYRSKQASSHATDCWLCSCEEGSKPLCALVHTHEHTGIQIERSDGVIHVACTAPTKDATTTMASLHHPWPE